MIREQGFLPSGGYLLEDLQLILVTPIFHKIPSLFNQYQIKAPVEYTMWIKFLRKQQAFIFLIYSSDVCFETYDLLPGSLLLWMQHTTDFLTFECDQTIAQTI